MARRFADLPEALENTVEIALRCRMPPARHPADPAALRRRPTRDPAAADREEAAELRRQAEAGLDRRLATLGMAARLHARATTATG